MTKEEAVRFKTQWELVNQARIEEVRRMSTVKKIKDLEMLFEFGERLGWPAQSGEVSWEYWRKLKELSNV